MSVSASTSSASRNARAARPIAGLVALGLATGLTGGAIGGLAVSSALASASGTCNAVDVAANALPGVVTVFAQGSGGTGSGSGAITASDGFIITNDHVIATAGASGRLSVLLNTGQSHAATLVGTDPKTDLAVLKIEASGLPTLSIRTDTGLRVGQQVIALGAPLGLSGTVTSGIVSALNRDVLAPVAGGGTTVLAGTVQTDASINPGNSGGPLVDCAGRIVGLNTVISTVPDASGVSGGGSVGLGFAVPASTVERITGELRRTGRATHPTMGLTLAEVPREVATRFGVEGGMYVQAVAAGGPGARVGIAVGDMIVSVGDQPANAFTVGRLLATARVGDTVTVVLVREGRRGEARVVLEEAP